MVAKTWRLTLHLKASTALQSTALLDLQSFALNLQCVECRLMDSADDVQGLGEGVKRRVKKRNSSKSIRIQADSQLPVSCPQV